MKFHLLGEVLRKNVLFKSSILDLDLLFLKALSR
jgi:hypothetical protein